ncbi:MAG TPA: four helix bundle protein [Candidatus Polarisedimenticolaceae bacterium]|nr:four helix bundle protein [Candidatus Polarisedimenticolaceae bacterium]
METLKSDRRIDVFRSTDSFAVEAYRAATQIRSNVGAGLAEEIRRTAVAAGGAMIAASSYPAGAGAERVHLERARAALLESRYYLHLARRFGWLDAKSYRALTLRQDAAVRGLDGLIGHGSQHARRER